MHKHGERGTWKKMGVCIILRLFELELELDDFLLDAAYGQAMSQRHADK